MPQGEIMGASDEVSGDMCLVLRRPRESITIKLADVRVVDSPSEQELPRAAEAQTIEGDGNIYMFDARQVQDDQQIALQPWDVQHPLELHHPPWLPLNHRLEPN